MEMGPTYTGMRWNAESSRVAQQMRFIDLCFLLEKESMAAECHRTPHRTLMWSLIVWRVHVMRRRVHLRGSEAALREALPVAVRMPNNVRFIAERRSRPPCCIERGFMMDPVRAIMCWRGATDRI